MVDICGMDKHILIVESILTNTTTVQGCDSIATLNLTVNNSSVSFTTITSCDSYVWNGATYTESGSYVFNTININGCDSTANLFHLSIVVHHLLQILQRVIVMIGTALLILLVGLILLQLLILLVVIVQLL